MKAALLSLLTLCLANAEFSPSSAAAQTPIVAHNFSVARHSSLPGDGNASTKLSDATSLLQTNNGFACSDVRCCVALLKSGSTVVFGSSNPAWYDVDPSEYAAILQDQNAMVKVVHTITENGQIVWGFATSRYSLGFESMCVAEAAHAAIWAHEFGHVQGIGDYTNSCPSAIMNDNPGATPSSMNAVTASECEDFFRAIPDIANYGSCSGSLNIFASYYVPQAGPYPPSTPIEGTSALTNFRACPNNHGSGSLPNNARVKVVCIDSFGNPISGISGGDVCILFNNGTPAQGFNGPGADSVISNSLWNTSPLCPTVTCVYADRPTDA